MVHLVSTLELTAADRSPPIYRYIRVSILWDSSLLPAALLPPSAAPPVGCCGSGQAAPVRRRLDGTKGVSRARNLKRLETLLPTDLPLPPPDYLFRRQT